MELGSGSPDCGLGEVIAQIGESTYRQGGLSWRCAPTATNTIDAWWPAAPASSDWSRKVVYETVGGGPGRGLCYFRPECRRR